MDNEIFIGVEAEGRLSGLPTVFAQRPSFAVLDKATKAGVTHILLGARGHILDDEDYQELHLLLSVIPQTWILTLHVPLDKATDIPSWAMARCHVVLYARCPIATALGGDVEVKLENALVAAIYTAPQMRPLHYVYDRNI